MVKSSPIWIHTKVAKWGLFPAMLNKVLPNKLLTLATIKKKKNRRNALTRISSEFHLKLTMNHHNYVASHHSEQQHGTKYTQRSAPKTNRHTGPAQRTVDWPCSVQCNLCNMSWYSAITSYYTHFKWEDWNVRTCTKYTLEP